MPVSDAQAALTLRLASGASTVTVGDNLAGDFNPAANAVLAFGTVGAWTVNVASALSKGVGFELDITTQQTSSASAGTLTIEVSDTGFGASAGAVTFLMNGAYTLPGSGGSVTYSAYQSNSDALFATDNLIGTIAGTVLSGASNTAVSGTASGTILGLTSPFSLTQVVTVTHNAAGTSSGDSELRVPEPGTLGLLGVGLMLLGFVGRFRKMHRQAASV